MSPLFPSALAHPYCLPSSPSPPPSLSRAYLPSPLNHSTRETPYTLALRSPSARPLELHPPSNVQQHEKPFGLRPLQSGVFITIPFF